VGAAVEAQGDAGKTGDGEREAPAPLDDLLDEVICQR
jgi:hypothetical protein